MSDIAHYKTRDKRVRRKGRSAWLPYRSNQALLPFVITYNLLTYDTVRSVELGYQNAHYESSGCSGILLVLSRPLFHAARTLRQPQPHFAVLPVRGGLGQCSGLIACQGRPSWAGLQTRSRTTPTRQGISHIPSETSSEQRR